MLPTFKNHPFAMEAFFESSLVLTFAVPKNEVKHLIPECLELHTFQDKWAFVAVAMVQTQDLRPKGFPKALGNNFFLIGYRIFVRYRTSEGKRLRGLYILKSETDKKRMAFMGNIFTHYNYASTDIHVNQNEIYSKQSKFQIQYNLDEVDVSLPESSPFSEWKEARRFAGPLPFTFTYNENTKEVLIIEGVRQNWKPKPIQIENYSIDFLDQLNLRNPILVNAFIINNIPYEWKKGKIDLWKHEENHFKAS
ncbi:MAG: DUF2071 domain-containing protein [Jejuia sp.]